MKSTLYVLNKICRESTIGMAQLMKQWLLNSFHDAKPLNQISSNPVLNSESPLCFEFHCCHYFTPNGLKVEKMLNVCYKNIL